jgi:heme exporter protein CcmD
MDHAPFIIASYAVFFVLLAIDAATPFIARRRLLARLRARLQRQQRREAP